MYQVLQWLEEIADATRTPTTSKQVDSQIAALREAANFRRMNGSQMQEVLTTAHFADLMGTALYYAFYETYKFKVGSWKAYTTPDSTPDFRGVRRFRMSQPGALYRRGEKGEAEADSRETSYLDYAPSEFARQMDFSWQLILADDLGQIKKTPMDMADAAARWLNSFVSALYDNATTQATLAALGAPWAGTGALTAANLAIGINAMKQRVDAQNNPIEISKLHLVIPSVLEIQAHDILKDLISYGGPGGNVLSDFLTLANVHIDPYITVGAAAPWYLFADPTEMPVVTVARLNGVPGPFVYKKASNIQMVIGSAPAPFLLGNAETGDLEYTVEDIVGGWDDASYVGVTDFRGIYYSSGTTP